MNKKAFLAPLAVSVAALLSVSNVQAHTSADAAVQKPAVEVVVPAVQPVADEFVIERTVPGVQTAQHFSHSSHVSHGSHGSHSSHTSSRY